MSDNWKEDREQFENETLPTLGRIGKEVGEKARAGNGQAQEVVRLYAQLHRSFDPLTHLMLRNALEDYLAP